VTIAAGILCSDGIVLGADTEHTGAIKQPGAKVWGLRLDNDHPIRAGLVGAGDSVLLRAARDRIANALAKNIRTAGKLVEAVEDQMVAMFQKHVFPHPGFRDNTFGLSLVFGVSDDKGCFLYDSSSTSFAQVDKYTCVGSGSDLGSYLLEKLMGSGSITSDVGVATMVYVLEQTKKYGLYCGGDSYILTIAKNGAIDYVSLDEVQLIEAAFQKGDPGSAVLVAAAEFRLRKMTSAKPPMVPPRRNAKTKRPNVRKAN
jgi:20S proteasome alpha/beta subunit